MYRSRQKSTPPKPKFSTWAQKSLTGWGGERQCKHIIDKRETWVPISALQYGRAFNVLLSSQRVSNPQNLGSATINSCSAHLKYVAHGKIFSTCRGSSHLVNSFLCLSVKFYKCTTCTHSATSLFDRVVGKTTTTKGINTLWNTHCHSYGDSSKQLHVEAHPPDLALIPEIGVPYWIPGSSRGSSNFAGGLALPI